MVDKKIRVLVVDDSAFFRRAVSNALEKDDRIEVVGMAESAFEARDMILKLRPDVMTLDVEMPKINGIKFLELLMPQRPMPVVMVSAVDGVVFEALKAGAVDFVEKPSSTSGSSGMKVLGEELAEKIVAASMATMPRPAGDARAKKPAGTTETGIKGVSLSPSLLSSGLIAIGASTGGTEATSKILRDIPPQFPGIVITQHMPPVFTKMYAERLNRECAISVKEAEEGDVVQPGWAYLAPGDKHMTVEKRGTKYIIHCKAGEKVSGHCPSINVLFNSIALFADKQTTGIALTGMGDDGATGLLAMKKRAAYTIGQDQESCVVYGIPKVAFDIGAVTKQASLLSIARLVIQYYGSLMSFREK